MLLEGFPRIVEGFPRSDEGFPRSEEGLPLEVSARPSDVSLGERSRRLLILGSTRVGCDGTTLPCVSITGYRLKELDTSALLVSLRRLTEGVVEVEGPTSADAGVASYLLVNAEPVFRRLRDDLLDGKILEVGMIRGGGFEMQKRSVKVLLDQRGTSRRNKGNREPSKASGNWRWHAAVNSGKSCDGKRKVVALETKTNENSSQRKLFAN